MARHKSYRAKREPFTFDFGGEPTPPFTARGGLGGMVLELGELAKLRDLDAESPEGMAAIATVFEMLLGPQEYARFREYVRTEGIDQDVLLELVQDLFVEVVGHPLAQPTDSSPGPTTSRPTYRVISPSGGVQELELTPEKEAELIAAMEREMTPGES